MAELPKDLRDAMYHAALNTLPCEHFQGSPQQGYETCIGCRNDSAIAALLDACEVREERGVRITWQPGTPCAGEYDDRWVQVDQTIAYHQHRIEENPHWGVRPSKVRRLIITTPTEEPTQ